MKKLFAMAALVAASVSVSAEVTPRAPIVPWGAQAEIIITNDLTEKYSDGSWHLTADAQQWIEYSYDGTTEGGTIQQTNRNNVWFDFYDEATDTMIVTSAEKNWGGYLSVTNKAGSKDGLMVVGKDRYPAFYVTGTDKAKFYFSGSASKAGYPQIEVYEVGGETPVATYTGDYPLTKSTWDHSTLLIADGLDKAKSYKIVARTMALDAETSTYTYEGNDVVLQVVKFYGDQAPMREDGVIINGSEIGNYINQHLAAYPEVTDFTLEGSGKYTIAEGIVAPGKFTLTSVASAPATIDASALTAPFAQLAAIAEDATLSEQGFLVMEKAVAFSNVNITGLGQPLFSSNKQNYLIPELTIDNSLITLTGNPFVIDFRNGGVVAKLAVSNSTIWAAAATGNSFFTGQSGKKATEAGLEEQIFSFTNSTLSNICSGKNFFTHRQAGQTWLTFEVKNSIFANCGKDNFLASLNQGQSSPNPKYVVEGNTFLKSVTEGEGEEAVTELSNINDLQSTNDEAEEIVNPIAGVPFTLANALAGNFKLASNSQQAKFMIGDPRWLVPYATDAIKVEVDMAENTDFVKVINDALAISEAPSSITVVFYEAGEYPTTAELNTTSPITFQVQDIEKGEATVVFNHGFTIGGAINFDGVNIKAGDELAAPIFTLQPNSWKIQANGYSNFGSIKLNNLTVSNLKTHLIQGVKGIQISEIETKNSQIFMADKISGSGNTPAIYDFRQGGVVVAWNFVNSTLDAANNAIFSTAGGEKATAAEGVTMQTLNITSSTIINPVKKAFQHRQNNQKWLRYILKNSLIFVNGEKTNFVAEMNAGSTGGNPVWQVSGNAFLQDVVGVLTDVSDKQSTGDNDEPVENNVVTTAAIFAGLADGNFDGTLFLSYDSYIPSAVGDPRWNLDIKPMVEFDMTALVGVSQADWNGAGTAGSWAAPFAVTADGRTAAMVENYNGATGEETGEYFTQTITGLPNGTYVVTLYANAMSTGQRDAAVLTDMEDGATDVCYVYANDSQVWMTAHLATTTSKNDEYTIVTTVTDGTLKMGLVKVKAGTNWHTINIKSLSRYVPMDEAWELAYNEVADKKMSDAAKSMLDAAYGAEKTYANYQELVKVIQDAQKSINSYAMIAAGVIPTDGLNGWAISTPQGELACNTWSTEGNTDGSGMTTPFIQDWVGAGNQLGAGNLYYTLEGVNPGETYEISALVRVFNEAAGDRTGASFFVGDATIDIAENGTACGGNFTEKGIYGTFTLQGTVDGEGKLKFGIAIAAESMLNWVAIKNVTITEVAAVIPSGDVTYALVEGDAFTSGQIVNVLNGDDVCATIQYGEEGGADFNTAAADEHCAEWGYTAFTAGNGVNGNKAGGTWYTITPKYNGIIAAAIALNADKKFHLAVNGEQNPVFDNNTVSEKYYGPIEFNVQAGKTYKFYCDGSKLGFYGFNYIYGPDVLPIEELSVAEQVNIVTGIETVQAPAFQNGAIYNLNGQQVQTLTKGLYIINGKKVMVR